MIDILFNLFVIGFSVAYFGLGIWLIGWGWKQFAEGWGLWFLIQDKGHKRQLELLDKVIELEKARKSN